MKTYNWEGVNPDGYFLDKLEPIPSALPSFQKLFQVSATALSIDRKSGSAGMPRPISYAVFCLKKKKKLQDNYNVTTEADYGVVDHFDGLDKYVEHTFKHFLID